MQDLFDTPSAKGLRRRRRNIQEPLQVLRRCMCVSNVAMIQSRARVGDQKLCTKLARVSIAIYSFKKLEAVLRVWKECGSRPKLLTGRIPCSESAHSH